MALFGKKTEEKKKEKPKQAEVKVKSQPKAEAPATPEEKPAKGSLIKRVYVSEKASRAKGLNQYVFEVLPNANRPEVKKEIEKKYGVHVLKMNILNRVSKKVTVGRYEGRRPALRKAIATLKDGESIPE